MASPRNRSDNPVSRVEWVDRNDLRRNEYNPNLQAPPEHRLLKVSILEDGWTQPIVVHRETMQIVDGEHRWKVSEDPEVQAMTGGMVPVVFVEGDIDRRMMSTVRHNRARGTHGVLPMAELVRALSDGGVPRTRIMKLMGMEAEEVKRLLDRAGQPERIGGRKAENGFGKSWKPVPKGTAK